MLAPWIEERELPGFSELLENGVYAPLLSTVPPVTAPAWKSLYSGKNPGQLGLYWWLQLNKRTGAVVHAGYLAGRSKDFWDYMGENDLEVLIMGTPLTYPPRPVKGILISGGPFTQDVGYTYPHELESELKEHFNFRVHPPHWPDVSLRGESGVRVIEELTENHLRTFDTLFYERTPSVGFLVLYHMVALGHFYFNGDETLRVWQRVDRYVRKWLEAGETVMVVSDHGLRRIEKEADLLTLCIQKGWTTVKSRGWRRYIKELVESLSQVPRASMVLPRLTTAVDIANSRLVPFTHGVVFVLDAAELIDELCSVLEEELADCVEKVCKGRELYSGPYVDDAPDLIVMPEKKVRLISSGAGGIVRSVRDVKADNAQTGFLIAAGEYFKKGVCEAFSIVDVAPTILHLMGCAVPSELDGKVLRDIFRPDSVTYMREVKISSETTERNVAYSVNVDEEKVIERLRDLGYLE